MVQVNEISIRDNSKVLFTKEKFLILKIKTKDEEKSEILLMFRFEKDLIEIKNLEPTRTISLEAPEKLEGRIAATISVKYKNIVLTPYMFDYFYVNGWETNAENNESCILHLFVGTTTISIEVSQEYENHYHCSIIVGQDLSVFVNVFED